MFTLLSLADVLCKFLLGISLSIRLEWSSKRRSLTILLHSRESLVKPSASHLAIVELNSRDWGLVNAHLQSRISIPQRPEEISGFTSRLWYTQRAASNSLPNGENTSKKKCGCPPHRKDDVKKNFNWQITLLDVPAFSNQFGFWTPASLLSLGSDISRNRTFRAHEVSQIVRHQFGSVLDVES